MKTLAGVACNHPQYVCSGLQKLLRKKWELVQRVTPGIGYTLGPVEEALQETFLLDLFQGLG